MQLNVCFSDVILLFVDISFVICVAREHNKYTRVKHLVIMKWSLFLAHTLERTSAQIQFTQSHEKQNNTYILFYQHNTKCNCAFALALSHLTVHLQAMNDNENSNKSLTLSPVCATAHSPMFRYSSSIAHKCDAIFALIFPVAFARPCFRSSMCMNAVLHYSCRFYLFVFFFRSFIWIEESKQKV